MFIMRVDCGRRATVAWMRACLMISRRERSSPVYRLASDCARFASLQVNGMCHDSSRSLLPTRVHAGAVSRACVSSRSPRSRCPSRSSSAAATYTDTAKTNSIVVKIMRADQDPDAEDTEPFTVDCKMVGGSAVENDDFTLSFKLPPSGIWKVTFPPGVNEQSFTVYTVKKPGPNKTFRLTLVEPGRPAVGDHGQQSVDADHHRQSAAAAPAREEGLSRPGRTGYGYQAHIGAIQNSV